MKSILYIVICIAWLSAIAEASFTEWVSELIEDEDPIEMVTEKKDLKIE